eukprot:4513522-Pyramimonas_sp.AAC.1
MRRACERELRRLHLRRRRATKGESARALRAARPSSTSCPPWSMTVGNGASGKHQHTKRSLQSDSPH